MILTPIAIFAIVFERASEMNAPPKPNSAANTSSPLRLPPFAVRY